MHQITPPRRALIELVILLLAALFVFTTAWLFGESDPLPRAVLPLGNLRNPLAYAVTALMIGLGIFALRRWREIARTESEFRALFENAPVGVFRSTPDGRFLMVNPALAQMLGYATPTEMLAAFTDITHQLYVDPERRREYLAQLHRDGIVRDFESQVYRKDGSIIWILGNGRAARNPKGNLLHIEGNVQDITARKEVEEAYASLSMKSLQALVILQEGHFVFVNPMTAEILGYSIQELLDFTFSDIQAVVHSDDREFIFSRVQDVLEGRLVPSRYVFQFQGKDARRRWMEVQLNRIEFHGKPAVLAVGVDVTERKTAQDKMQENMLRAQMSQDLSAALARAGNDLNAVVNTLARVIAGAVGESCTVMLVSRDEQFLEPVAYDHPNPRIATRVWALLRAGKFPMQVELYETALATGQPILIETMDEEQLARLGMEHLTPVLKPFRAFSLLLVPLRAQTKMIGVFAVARHRPAPAFQSQDQRVVQEIADRAALAITNAQLVQQLQTELAARHEVDEKYRTLVEQIPAIAYIASTERVGEMIYVSPQIEAALGFTPAEWIATRDFWATRLHPDDRSWVLQHAQRARHSRLPFQAEYRLLARDGSAHWIRDEGRLVLDEAQRVLYQHGIMLDITAHKVLEMKYAQAIRTADSERAALKRELITLREFSSAALSAPTLGDMRLDAETAEHEQRAFARALSDVAALMNRAAEYEQVLDGILDTVARIVPYETASIFMRDGTRLKMARARGFEKFGLQEWVYGVTFPADMPKFQLLVAHGTPIVIRETREYAGWIELAETNWIRSQVSAPIRVGGETVGMLGLDSAQPNFYNAEHGTRLLAFADLAAAAIRNAQLLTETRKRAEQLALMYDMGLTLNRVLDARTQLNFLFTIAQRALRSDNMAYFHYDPKSETVVYELGVGVPHEIETQLRKEPLSALAAEGAVGWIAHHRLPALIADVNTDPRWQKIDRVVHSAVGVPVEHEQILLGVLMAVRYKPEPFTAQDERLLVLFGNQVAAAMELTRLFQGQAQRQHELEILREASLAFASAQDRGTLTPLILQFALQLVAANNAFLFFYQNDELEYGGTLWTPDSLLKMEVFVPRRDGFTYTVARTGQMIVIDEVNTHPLFATWQWGGAIVGLPLKGGGDVRAVLNLAYAQPHVFAPAELRALELLADQAAVALENARHAQETQQQLRDAQLLHRAGEALNRTLAFEETLERLADFFMEAVQVQVCCISTVDVAHDEMRVILDRDPLPETRDVPGKKYTLSIYPHLVQILGDKRTLTLRRDAPDLPPGLDNILDEYKWQALMILPLLAGDEIIGFVELADQTTARGFTPEQRRLAESLAHQAASALHNAQLFEQAQRRAEYLAVLNHIARQVNTAQTLDEMLAVIERETATVLPSDASYIALYDAATEMVDFHRVVDFGVPRAPFQWRLGPSFTRQVITTARALRMDDRNEYPSVENPGQFYGEGSTLRSWLGVPIRFGDQVLGVISLQAVRPRAYSESDEQLLQTIADQVAVAIVRAQEVERARV